MKIIQIIDVRWHNACADFAIKQAQGLKLRGHDVLLLANPGSPPGIEAKKVGLDVCEEINFSGKLAVASAPSRLRGIARCFGADVIIAHRGESHLIGALAARGMQFRIARFRGDVRAPRSDIFNRWLNERLTNGIAVSTMQLKKDYENKFRLNGIPIKIIYPGIDLDCFRITAPKAELKLKFGLNPDNIVIGIVGRLSPVKGHRYFLEAASIVGQKYPKAQFVIAGGDAQIKMGEMKELAASLEVKNIRFFEVIDNIVDLIGAFDIGVVASIGSEMICRVLLEYFALGLPVVATSVNQISEIMELSHGGILVPPEDSASLSAALLKLIEDVDKREKYSALGKSWVDGRSLQDLGGDTELFLTEVHNVQ